MTQRTISAQVLNGHLCHAVELSELEGERVIATLTVVPKDAANGKAGAISPPHAAGDEFDPEPPPWLDVENDVYFPMNVPEKLLEKRTLIVERGTPSIILPEDLPDE